MNENPETVGVIEKEDVETAGAVEKSAKLYYRIIPAVRQPEFGTSWLYFG